ncbi:hypothetical protein MC885_020885, partial [Smutsia gigantea]
RACGPLEDSLHSSSITSLPPVAVGIPADSGPGSAQSSSCPGNTSSSSPLPPPPHRFLLRLPAGLLRPAPSAPRVRPARGPASPGSPHPGAWLHEAGGAGRAREVPCTPAASGPGEEHSRPRAL